jgi:hypothetical protein
MWYNEVSLKRSPSSPRSRKVAATAAVVEVTPGDIFYLGVVCVVAWWMYGFLKQYL